MATLFIKCHKNSAAPSIPSIVAAVAAHGVEIKIEQVRLPLFYDGPNKGKPRNFAFVHSLSRAHADVLVALAKVTFERAIFLINEARPRIPARFSDQGIPPAAKPRAPEHFKPFTENDFR